MAPRLPVLSAREVIRSLAQRGVVPVGQTGSHLRLKRKDSTGTRLVVVPRHGELAPGTLAAILRRSGFSREDVDRLRR